MTQKQIERAYELEKAAMKRLAAKRNAKVRKDAAKKGKSGLRRPMRPARPNKQTSDNANK